MPIIKPYLRPMKSETLGAGLSNPHFNKLFRRFLLILLGVADFFCKGQVVYILGIAVHVVSVTTIQLCYCSHLQYK